MSSNDKIVTQRGLSGVTDLLCGTSVYATSGFHRRDGNLALGETQIKSQLPEDSTWA